MENSQQKVKFIPIFVEGRDEPVLNRGHDEHDGSQSNAFNSHPNVSSSSNSSTSAFADSSSSGGPFPHHQNHGSFGRPSMNFGNDIGFGQDIPMPSGGSLFDRAKDFPVRDFFNSARRSESPIGVHHQQQQQPVRNPSGGRQNQSQERQIPVINPEQRQQRSTTPQRPTSQNNPLPQEQKQSQPNSVPAKQKAIEDSIEKIQKIQQSVMELMGRVEQYDGNNQKEYMFLDEMLTQNLLKLDNIDAEGKENIKSARREAIKCINHLISLLEVKRDEAKEASGEQVQKQVENKDESTESQHQQTSAEESLEQKISAAANSESK